MTDIGTPSSPQSLTATQQVSVPLYRNATVIKWVLQVVTLGLVVFAIWFFAKEAGDNLSARNLSTDFDFINIDQGFDIGEGIDNNPDTGGRALWVGMVNTLRLAIAAIIFSTILGVIVGVSRLSHNWIVNRVASVFIETLRNIPLLVQIMIWLAVFQGLGRLTFDTGPSQGWFVASAKGLSMPRVFIADGFYQWAVWLLIGAIVARFVYRNRVAERDATGHETHAGLLAFGAVLVFAVIGWFAHPVFGFLGSIFHAIRDVWADIPQLLLQLVFAGLCVAASGWWIKRFLDSRRTPAGLAKLTDDDYFRIIFSIAGAVFGAIFFLWLWPGFSSWVINSGVDFWNVAGDKFGTDEFGNDRTGQPIDAMRPTIIGENIANYGPEGLNLSIGFSSMFVALSLYTAAFIAEIVRGGILAVPKGQLEAASAIGLSRLQSLRFIILPQAFRVSLPPLGNQYLNLTKNTSLAIAALYADVFNIGNTVINQSGRALSVFAIWMAFYLACSLTISVVVNFFNVRLAIVER